MNNSTLPKIYINRYHMHSILFSIQYAEGRNYKFMLIPYYTIIHTYIRSMNVNFIEYLGL